MNVFRINLGNQHGFREEAIRKGAVLLYEDADVAEARQRGSDSEVRAAIGEALRRMSGDAKAAQVTLWQTHHRYFTESCDDLWLHYESRNCLWWGMSFNRIETSGPQTFEDRENSKRTVMKYWKSLDEGWSNTSKKGSHLAFSKIHPKALRTLVFQGTLSRINDEIVKSYFLSLIEDADLGEFYELPDWQEEAKRVGWRPQPEGTSTHPDWNTTVSAIAQSVIGTVNASGSIRESKAKDKRLDMTESQLHEHIKGLLERQGYRCALTGIELMKFGAEPMCRSASLDRIDSDGHYSIGNLQLVCRFVNFMKGDTPNEEFRHYLELIRKSPA